MARIIFLQRIWHEYLGPEIISANLKKHGHHVDLFIGRDTRSFLDKIQPKDIIAFSTMTGEHHWALEVAKGIKNKKDVMSIFGGPHPTFFPDIIKHPAVDIICRGEGEFSMLDLANACDKGNDYINIPNLSVKRGSDIKRNDVRPLIGDLNEIPFPDRELYYAKYRIIKESYLKPFMASRGCPFLCSFCFNEKLRTIYANKGQYVRFYSPLNLINQIKEVLSKYRFKSIYFMDDLFALNQKWLEEFAALYKKEIKMPFVCSSHVNALNEDIIRILKDAGCRVVSFGIETGNERLRNQLLNKHITNGQIEEIARLFKKYKLKFITFNMIGFPGETVSDALETIELNIRMGTPYPRCSFVTPYPGTEIAKRYKDKLIMKDIGSIDQQTRLSFEVKEPEKLYNLHYFFQTAILFPYLLRPIKKLVGFRPNILFKLWWIVVYFFIITRSETRNFFHTLIIAHRTFSFSLKEKDRG
ncbi:MAG: B12-binding domain-containing radical SAM protein [Candidatus Omnitrophica bacterium]|nr:B12-binding domain-containing radical SAM protein [Candidatus Omnitrophota bacterium]